MDSQARLNRALAADAAPRCDPAFTLAVLRAAERDRFRREALRSALTGGALASAAAGVVIALTGWASVNVAGLQTGILGTLSLLLVVAGARAVSGRARVLLRR